MESSQNRPEQLQAFWRKIEHVAPFSGARIDVDEDQWCVVIASAAILGELDDKQIEFLAAVIKSAHRVGVAQGKAEAFTSQMDLVNRDCRIGDRIVFILSGKTISAVVLGDNFGRGIRIRVDRHHTECNVTYDELTEWKARYIERAT